MGARSFRSKCARAFEALESCVGDEEIPIDEYYKIAKTCVRICHEAAEKRVFGPGAYSAEEGEEADDKVYRGV